MNLQSEIVKEINMNRLAWEALKRVADQRTPPAGDGRPYPSPFWGIPVHVGGEWEGEPYPVAELVFADGRRQKLDLRRKQPTEITDTAIARALREFTSDADLPDIPTP